MGVLKQHEVTEDRTLSTDWTTLGRRILEAATRATAIHLEMAGTQFPGRVAERATRRFRCDGEMSDGNG